MAAKSSRFWRKTVVFTRRSSPLPASSRIARRFCIACSVCAVIPSSTGALSPGRRPSWPATKTRPAAFTAWLYGAPWNGAGARSVRTISFSAIASPRSVTRGREAASSGILERWTSAPAELQRTRSRQRGAEGLEDGFEHVPRVFPVDQADVQREAGGLGERVEEAGGKIAAESARAGLGQIDVAVDEGPVRDLEDDLGERLVGRHERRAVAGHPRAAEHVRERLPERGAGGGDLSLAFAGRQLEPELEAAAAGELGEEMVEDGDAGRDVRRAPAGGDPSAHVRFRRARSRRRARAGARRSARTRGRSRRRSRSSRCRRHRGRR